MMLNRLMKIYKYLDEFDDYLDRDSIGVDEEMINNTLLQAKDELSDLIDDVEAGRVDLHHTTQFGGDTGIDADFDFALGDEDE